MEMYQEKLVADSDWQHEIQTEKIIWGTQEGKQGRSQMGTIHDDVNMTVGYQTQLNISNNDAKAAEKYGAHFLGDVLRGGLTSTAKLRRRDQRASRY